MTLLPSSTTIFLVLAISSGDLEQELGN